MLMLHHSNETDYVDLEKVRAEGSHASRPAGWSVIDVTRRSIGKLRHSARNMRNFMAES